MKCLYCENPLECEACRELYSPKGLAEYHALSHPEVPIVCESCGSVLVCHWCKTPYDGEGDADQDST